MLRSWSDDVVVFASDDVTVPSELIDEMRRQAVQFEPRRVSGLVVKDGHLTHVALAGGEQIPCPVLFAHPAQRQVDVVKALELALDPQGYVHVDPMTRQTSTPGIYAAGDLTTRAQGAIFAAAMGTQAGGMLNHDLATSAERASDVVHPAPCGRRRVAGKPRGAARPDPVGPAALRSHAVSRSHVDPAANPAERHQAVRIGRSS